MEDHDSPKRDFKIPDFHLKVDTLKQILEEHGEMTEDALVAEAVGYEMTEKESRYLIGYMERKGEVSRGGKGIIFAGD